LKFNGKISFCAIIRKLELVGISVATNTNLSFNLAKN